MILNMSFRPLYSMQGQSNLSFFFHKENPALAREKEGRMIPAASTPWMHLSLTFHSDLTENTTAPWVAQFLGGDQRHTRTDGVEPGAWFGPC